MKKFLAILLIVASIFSLAACSSEVPSGEATATTQPTTVHTDPTDAPTEAPTEAATEPTTVPTEPPTEAPTEPTTSQDIPCESIVISNHTIEFMNKGDTWTIQVRTTPANTTDTITFTSNDPSVATIDQSGLITALNSGKAMITVTCGSITQTCYTECNFYTTPSPTQKPTQKPTSAPATEPADDGHVHNYYKEGKDYTYCYEEGLNLLYCDCGAYRVVSGHPAQRHYMNIRTTIVKATHNKEGLDEVKCTNCPYTTTEVTPKVNVPYLVDVVLVSHERPNECYLSDGTPILERIYGKKYCQVGDVLTYKVIMSDGGSEGFTVRNELPMVADVEVNGNLIKITVTDRRFDNDAIDISVISNDIDNNWKNHGIFVYIVLGNYKFTEIGGSSRYVMLRDYITNNGMESYLFMRNEYNSGELIRYTKDDPSKSITGTAQYGYDDYIIIEKYEDWLQTYFDLIDAYKARGFTKIYMDYEVGMAYEDGYSDIIVLMAS